MLHDIILGIVQGLTEFLPVSSSGHLVVVPAVLGWEQPSLTFDLVLHLGTLVAVLVAYRRDLLALGRGVLGGGPDPAAARRSAALLALATVPAAVAGLVLGGFFEDRFDDPTSACIGFVVTAAVLLATDHLVTVRRDRRPRPLDARRAGAIGLAQAVAILPGVSRSGSTICAGVAGGVPQTDAANFSFLLSIPVIAGAVASQAPDLTSGRFDVDAGVVAGFLAAAVSGYLAIGYFLRYVRHRPLRAFAYYLLVVAAVSTVVLEVRG